MIIIPTTEQIEEAIRQLTVSNTSDNLAEALASSPQYVAFTSALLKQIEKEQGAAGLTPEQVCVTMMQAYTRLGIHIGVVMASSDGCLEEG